MTAAHARDRHTAPYAARGPDTSSYVSARARARTVPTRVSVRDHWMAPRVPLRGMDLALARAVPLERVRNACEGCDRGVTVQAREITHAFANRETAATRGSRGASPRMRACCANAPCCAARASGTGRATVGGMLTKTIRTRNAKLTVIAAGYPGTRLAFHARVDYLGARIAAPGSTIREAARNAVRCMREYQSLREALS